MKFLCDQCKAKYQIADEKVQGKTLKMKCRKCGHVIEIRAAEVAGAGAGATMHLPSIGDDEAAAAVADRHSVAPPAPEAHAKPSIPRAAPTPAPTGAPRPGAAAAAPRPGAPAAKPATPAPKPETSPRPAAAPPPGTALSSAFAKVATKKDEPPPSRRPEVPADEWYAAIDEVPVGPIRLSDMRAKYGEGALTDDSLVWREGFEEWRPLRTLTDLHALMREEASHRSTSSILPGAPRPSTRPAPARPAAPATTPSTSTASTSGSRSNVIPFSPSRGGAAAARKVDEEELEDQEATRVALQAYTEPAAPASQVKPVDAPAASTVVTTTAHVDPFAAPATAAARHDDHHDALHPHRKGMSTGIVALIAAACVLVGVVLAVVIVGGKPKTVVQEKVIEREKPAEVVTVYLPASNQGAAPGGAVASVAPSATGTTPRVASAGGPVAMGTPGGGSGTSTAATAADTNAAPPPPSGDAQFSQAAAEQVINGRKVGIRKKCIEPYADQGGASVSVTLAIQPDGTVSSSSYTGNSTIGACVARMAKSFTFPKSATGGTITFNLIAS
jgi:predicted Zn finger-like uncharacterized protein